MDLRRLRLGEWATGAFSVALLASTFMPWYEPRASCARAPCPPDEALSAWSSFAVVDVLLVLAALMGLAAWLTAALYRTAPVPMAVASLATLFGILVSTVLVVRLALPVAEGPQPGLWLGLLAVLGVTAAGWTTVRDEGPGFWPTQDPARQDRGHGPAVELVELPAPERSRR